MAEPRVFEIDEQESGRYTATVVGNDGVTPLGAGDLQTLALTVYAVTQDGSTAILRGPQQDVLNANGVTVDANGALVWSIQPSDTTLVEAIPFELHFCLFEWTAPDVSGKHLVVLKVRNLRLVP